MGEGDHLQLQYVTDVPWDPKTRVGGRAPSTAEDMRRMSPWGKAATSWGLRSDSLEMRSWPMVSFVFQEMSRVLSANLTDQKAKHRFPQDFLEAPR